MKIQPWRRGRREHRCPGKDAWLATKEVRAQGARERAWQPGHRAAAGKVQGSVVLMQVEQALHGAVQVQVRFGLRCGLVERLGRGVQELVGEALGEEVGGQAVLGRQL